MVQKLLDQTGIGRLAIGIEATESRYKPADVVTTAGPRLATTAHPWLAGCQTTMIFAANGIYTAHSPGEACIVLYYVRLERRFSRKEVLDRHRASDRQRHHHLQVWPGNTNPGTLRNVHWSDDANTLSFDAYKGEYGPLKFSLNSAQ